MSDKEFYTGDLRQDEQFTITNARSNDSRLYECLSGDIEITTLISGLSSSLFAHTLKKGETVILKEAYSSGVNDLFGN